MSTVIRVENLSKKYFIMHEGKESYVALRDVLTNTAKNIGSRLFHPFLGKGENSHRKEEFWALKNVSFEIKQGERVGIIGRNGAGKSTVLKLLSRITEPTEGRMRIKGRVSSLLEVGTGFHPELTGRENIYLNGAILGMSRTEIINKFDEIVAFSEVEEFLDTPVKRYSSGMQVRLAFAIAAHLEPEILLVDEVLAVGDAQFQRKCLGKMEEVSGEGRTIVFVSHNMAAIQQLCNRTILLDKGRIKDNGSPEYVIGRYLSQGGEESHINLVDYEFRNGSQDMKFEWAQIQNVNNDITRHFSIGEDVLLVFCIKPKGGFNFERVKLAVSIRSNDGTSLCHIVDEDSNFQVINLDDKKVIEIIFRDIRFYPGTYYITLWASDITSLNLYDSVVDCLSFVINDGGKKTRRHLPRHSGIIFLTPDWRTIDNL